MLVVVLAALVAVAAVASSADAVASECGNQRGCSSCVMLAGCGWCSATQLCQQGDATGPTNGTLCLGASWHKGVGSCRDCTKVKSCKQCVDYENDCMWCAGATGGSCHGINATKPLGCSVTNQCDCSDFGECSQCLDRTNGHCAWCVSDNTCKYATATPTECPSLAKDRCPCSEFTECGSCVAEANCQYCADPSKKPQGGYCSELGASAGCNAPASCDAFCNAAQGCSDCVSRNGCAYCSNTGKCVDVEFSHGNCMIMHACPVDCSANPDCESCDRSAACTWCASEGACKDQSKDSCSDSFWSHTCPNTNPGECPFDGGAFVGGMFTIIGLFVIGAIIGLVYRWKRGARVAYRELSG